MVLLPGACATSAVLADEVAGVAVAIADSRGLRTAVRRLLLVGVGGRSEAARGRGCLVRRRVIAVVYGRKGRAGVKTGKRREERQLDLKSNST